MKKKVAYHGIEEANALLRELGVSLVPDGEHYKVTLNQEDESLMIVALWHEENGFIRASFGVSVLSMVAETADEAHSFAARLIKYNHVFEKLLKISVYGTTDDYPFN